MSGFVVGVVGADLLVPGVGGADFPSISDFSFSLIFSSSWCFFSVGFWGVFSSMMIMSFPFPWGSSSFLGWGGGFGFGCLRLGLLGCWVVGGWGELVWCSMLPWQGVSFWRAAIGGWFLASCLACVSVCPWPLPFPAAASPTPYPFCAESALSLASPRPLPRTRRLGLWACWLPPRARTLMRWSWMSCCCRPGKKQRREEVIFGGLVF